MNRVPVGETVRFAYNFTFGQLGTIIGLIWVPMLAVAVLGFLPYALGDMSLSPDENPAAAGAASLRGIAFWLVSMLLYACINVSVMKQALGLRTGGAVAHFSLGAPEFRLWGASLIFIGIILLLMVGCLIALFAAGVAAGASGNRIVAGLIGAAVGFAGLCVILLSMVRLGFLMVPITVAESKISFERGWTLTRGNFWRISAVLFFVTLPTFLLVFGAFLILMGPEMTGLFRQASHLSQQALADGMQAIINRHIAVILGVNLIVAPFSVGLVLGACAAGYKALTAHTALPEQTAA